MTRRTITQVARNAEVSRDTVKKCEQRGLITSIRDKNGWRWFDDEAVKTLRQLYCRGAGQTGEEKRSSVA